MKDTSLINAAKVQLPDPETYVASRIKIFLRQDMATVEFKKENGKWIHEATEKVTAKDKIHFQYSRGWELRIP